MDSCPRSLDNMQLERELPHCLSAKEGVWAWSTTNGLKLQPLSGQAESEGKRGEENTSVLWKRWKMNQFPPSLQNWDQRALEVPISELQVIKTFSLPLSPTSAWHRKPVAFISSWEMELKLHKLHTHVESKQMKHAMTTHLCLIRPFIKHLQSFMHPEIWT